MLCGISCCLPLMILGCLENQPEYTKRSKMVHSTSKGRAVGRCQQAAGIPRGTAWEKRITFYHTVDCSVKEHEKQKTTDRFVVWVKTKIHKDPEPWTSTGTSLASCFTRWPNTGCWITLVCSWIIWSVDGWVISHSICFHLHSASSHLLLLAC